MQALLIGVLVSFAALAGCAALHLAGVGLPWLFAYCAGWLLLALRA